MVALVCLGTSGCSSPAQVKNGNQAPPPVVLVTDLKSADVPIFSEFPAQTYARNSVEVRGRVDGYIDKWLFRPGQEVSAGDVLYVLDLRPYEAAVGQAQGNLARAKRISTSPASRWRCCRQKRTSPVPGQSGQGAAGLRSPDAASGAGGRGQTGTGRRSGRAALGRSHRESQPGQRRSNAPLHRNSDRLDARPGGS